MNGFCPKCNKQYHGNFEQAFIKNHGVCSDCKKINGSLDRLKRAGVLG